MKPPRCLVTYAPGSDQDLHHAVQVVPVTEPEERRRVQGLLKQHHSLGGLSVVGEPDLTDRTVALDAQDTQAQTALERVQEHGGRYLLTVRNHQPTLRRLVRWDGGGLG